MPRIPLTAWRTYILRAEQTQLIKIGRARDVAKRFAGLQHVNADTLTLLCVVPESEYSLHQKFAHLRVHGEWFKPDAAMLIHVESMVRASQPA